MMIDKTYRSLVKPLLIGIQNQDAFDLEDESITLDTKIPVTDINQVREMEISGVGNADMAMLERVKGDLEQSSVDQVQGGTAGSGVTAREIVIANENARRLKSIFFMFLEDLWLQKTKLRVVNILTNYTIPLVEEIDGAGEEYKTFMVPGMELSNGEQGMLQVQVVKDQTQLPKQSTIDSEEKQAQKEGLHMEKVAITSNYLDEYIYDIAIVPGSLYATDKAEAQATIVEKLQILATMFPEFFMQNKPEFLKQLLPAYGDTMENYSMPAMQPQGQPGQPGGQGPQGTPVQAGGQPVNPMQNSMPALMDALAKK
jgi:hypothetical protein